MEQSQVELLNEIGLSKTEAAVYLSLLAEGPSSILQLSEATEIKRSTIYPAIDSLIEQGLINIQQKGKRKLFAAETPKRLQHILNNTKKQLDQALPQLMNQFYNIRGEDSFIKHYNGLEGVKSIFDNLLTDLKAKDFYYVFSDSGKWHALDPEFFGEYSNRRATLGLDIKMLLADNDYGRSRKQNEKQIKATIRLLPNINIIDTALVIVPTKVIIVQTKGPLMAMVIANQSYVDLNKALFELVFGLSLNSDSSNNLSGGPK